MATVRFGTTGPDGSFTAAGASAWNRVLLADATASPPPSWTFPDQDATILANGMAASLQSLTLTGQSYGSPSLNGSRLLVADDSGNVSALSTAYQTENLAIIGQQALVLPIAYASHTRRDATTAGGYAVITADAIVTPDSDGYGNSVSLTAGKFTPRKSGSFSFDTMTAADCWSTNTGTGRMLSMVGVSGQAQNSAAAPIDYLVGGYFAVRSTNDGSVVGSMICVDINPTGDGGYRRGRTENYYGLIIRGMTLDTTGSPNHSFTAGNRYQLYLAAAAGSVTGSPGGDDFAIYSLATQPSLLTGALGIGVSSAPAAKLEVVQNDSWGTFTPSYAGAVAQDTVAVVRQSVSATTARFFNAALTVNADVAFTGLPGIYAVAGASITATVTSSDTATWNAGSTLLGMNLQASYEGGTGSPTGSIPTVIGGKFIANRHRSAGNVTSYMAGGEFGITTGAGGAAAANAIALAIGVHVLRPTGSAGMTFTDTVGLQIENQTSAAGTKTNTPFGIKQLGAGDINSFAGNIKIGGTTTVRSTTEGTNHIDLFDGTAPVGTLSNGCTVYSGGGFLKSSNAAGTIGFVLSSSAVATEVVVTDTTLTIERNGTTYKLLAKA